MDNPGPSGCKKAKIEESSELKFKEIINKQRHEYEEMGLSSEEIDKLKSLAASKLIKKSKTLDNLRNSDDERKISFGCTSLDELTDGGVPLKGITEIYGPSGSGKTQICLQLALNVQRSKTSGGLNKGCVYISTTKTFPVKRLKELADHIADSNADTLLNNVFIREVFNQKDFQTIIDTKLPFLCERKAIGLVVIDSIAGIFRPLSDDLINRAGLMKQFYNSIRSLQRTFNFAVICVNEVTSVFEDEKGGRFDEKFKASLGPTWRTLIKTKLEVNRTNQTTVSDCGKHITTRTMKVVFSPIVPIDKCQFLVQESGLTNVD